MSVRGECAAGGVDRRWHAEEGHLTACLLPQGRRKGEWKDGVSAGGAWSPEVEGAWRFLGIEGVGGEG